MKFDQKTIHRLGYYVYALIDSTDGRIFYIGKGNGNRVFEHLACALKCDVVNLKYDTIRRIKNEGGTVNHLILRSRLSEAAALEVESSLIDFAEHLDLPITNEIAGHNSATSGIMTAEDVIRKFSAKPLTHLQKDAVIININKSFSRVQTGIPYYEATRELWPANEKRIHLIKFVLSEYKGLIEEVFKVDDWYSKQVSTKNGKPRKRWGFNGTVAPAEVRDKYRHKTIAHMKKRGAAFPLRYTI